MFEKCLENETGNIQDKDAALFLAWYDQILPDIIPYMVTGKMTD